jgi:uncharacterized protein YjbI with pentapeptide repeats
MDPNRFDQATRAFSRLVSRRTGLQLALGVAIGLGAGRAGGAAPGLELEPEGDKRKRRRQRRRKNRRNPNPVQAPQPCKTTADCEIAEQICLVGSCMCIVDNQPRKACGGVCCLDGERCVDGRCVRDCSDMLPLMDYSDLSRCDLTGVDLSGRYLYVRVDFSGSVMRGANLSGATFQGANFSGAMLAGVNFSQATIRDCQFDPPETTTTDLTGANLTGAKLLDCDLTGADLTGALLRSTVINNTVMTGTILTDARLTKVTMIHLNWPDFDATVIRQRSLEEAFIQNCDLRDAKMGGAFLYNARFDTVNLSGADLSHVRTQGDDGVKFFVMDRCTLDRSTLRNAELKWSHISDTTFIGADFSFAQVGSKSTWRRCNLWKAKLNGWVEPNTICDSVNPIGGTWSKGDCSNHGLPI